MEKRSKSQLFFAKKMKMKIIKLQGIPAFYKQNAIFDDEKIILFNIYSDETT